MAAPSYAFTIARAAELLGEDEELLEEISIGMEPEDGCLTIHGTNDTNKPLHSHPSASNL